jgi:hypothetical protein
VNRFFKEEMTRPRIKDVAARAGAGATAMSVAVTQRRRSSGESQSPPTSGTALLNTYRVKIVPFIADGLSIFLFHQHFTAIPVELDATEGLHSTLIGVQCFSSSISSGSRSWPIRPWSLSPSSFFLRASTSVHDKHRHRPGSLK